MEVIYFTISAEFYTMLKIFFPFYKTCAVWGHFSSRIPAKDWNCKRRIFPQSVEEYSL